MRRAVMVPEAVKPAGPYSHAIVANGFIYVSGQGPVDPATGVVPENFAAQVAQVLRNLQTILEGTDSSLADIVKITAYLGDLSRFEEYNAVYRDFFPSDPPARTTIGCQLSGIQIEIDCIAIASDR